MRATIAAICLASVTALTGCAPSELTIINDSSEELVEIRVVDLDFDNFPGPNEIPEGLLPDESVTLTGLSCGTYDFLVVTESDTDCNLRDVDLCLGESKVWRITDSLLDLCDIVQTAQ